MDRSKAKPVAKTESESNMDDVMAIFGDQSLVGAVTRVSDGIGEHSATLAAVQQKMDGKILWVIDSDATDHVCKDWSAIVRSSHVHRLCTTRPPVTTLFQKRRV